MTQLQPQNTQVATIVREAGEMARDLVAQFPGTEITDEDSFKDAGEALTRITAWLRASEQERVKLVKPLNETVKNINTMVKEGLALVEKEEGRLRRMLSVFRAKVEQERRDEYAKAQEETKEAFPEGSPIPETVAPIPEDPVELKQVVTGSGSVHFATVWHNEIVDETKVPRKYLMVDTSRINRVVKAESGKVRIPGIRIWSTQEPVVRGR